MRDANMPHNERPGRATGHRLDAHAYGEDFGRNFWQTGASGFWKLERRQVFREPDSESWKAFAGGDWTRALQLHESRRSAITDYNLKIARHGFRTWWVRVVEKPITPYLQWELHLLRLRSQCGDNLRVVSLDQVAHFEKCGRLPEIVSLGSDVMYEVEYDETGLPNGGTRCVDRDSIVRWREFIQDLYRGGEEIESFFEREVAGLEPPSGT
jgi:hypothetical protein